MDSEFEIDIEPQGDGSRNEEPSAFLEAFGLVSRAVNPVSGESPAMEEEAVVLSSLPDDMDFPTAVEDSRVGAPFSVTIARPDIDEQTLTEPESKVLEEPVADVDPGHPAVEEAPEPVVPESVALLPAPVAEPERVSEFGESATAPSEPAAETSAEDPGNLHLECPGCGGGLVLRREHLGIEGLCVWCRTPIVAAESARDGQVRVYPIFEGNPDLKPALPEVKAVEAVTAEPEPTPVPETLAAEPEKPASAPAPLAWSGIPVVTPSGPAPLVESPMPLGNLTSERVEPSPELVLGAVIAPPAPTPAAPVSGAISEPIRSVETSAPAFAEKPAAAISEPAPTTAPGPSLWSDIPAVPAPAPAPVAEAAATPEVLPPMAPLDLESLYAVGGFVQPDASPTAAGFSAAPASAGFGGPVETVVPPAEPIRVPAEPITGFGEFLQTPAAPPATAAAPWGPPSRPVEEARKPGMAEPSVPGVGFSQPAPASRMPVGEVSPAEFVKASPAGFSGIFGEALRPEVHPSPEPSGFGISEAAVNRAFSVGSSSDDDAPARIGPEPASIGKGFGNESLPATEFGQTFRPETKPNLFGDTIAASPLPWGPAAETPKSAPPSFLDDRPLDEAPLPMPAAPAEDPLASHFAEKEGVAVSSPVLSHSDSMLAEAPAKNDSSPAKAEPTQVTPIPIVTEQTLDGKPKPKVRKGFLVLMVVILGFACGAALASYVLPVDRYVQQARAHMEKQFGTTPPAMPAGVNPAKGLPVVAQP